MRAVVCNLLLALLAGARADTSVNCGDYMTPNELRRPKMTVTANMRSCPNNKKRRECTIPYGGDTTVTIQCTSDDASNIYMHKHLEDASEAEQVNSTTIQLTLKGLRGGLITYMCKDIKTNCENRVHVKVDIMMSVISSTDYYRVSAGNVDEYLVLYNDTYEVYCRAEDSALIIKTYDSQPLPLVILNETTAKVKRQADQIGEELYLCQVNRGQNRPYSDRMLNVVVDYPAEAHNFRCIFHDMRKLECSWTSSSIRNTFKLFYIFPNFPDDPSLICTDNTGGVTGSCTWNNKLFGRTIVEVPDHSLNLLLETCNEFYCNKQSFNFLPREITRTDVTGLQLVNTSSDGADLMWNAPVQFVAYSQGIGDRENIFYFKINNLDYMYRIQYRLPSAPWRHANTSSVDCDRLKCKFHLDLPCPDWRYQVRVSGKIVQAAGDRFWSEPASLYVFTDPQNTADAMKPECYAALPELEPITNPDTAAREIDKLMREITNGRMAFKKKLHDMKVKIGEVKELRELLAGLGAE